MSAATTDFKRFKIRATRPPEPLEVEQAVRPQALAIAPPPLPAPPPVVEAVKLPVEMVPCDDLDASVRRSQRRGRAINLRQARRLAADAQRFTVIDEGHELRGEIVQRFAPPERTPILKLRPRYLTIPGTYRDAQLRPYILVFSRAKRRVTCARLDQLAPVAEVAHA